MPHGNRLTLVTTEIQQEPTFIWLIRTYFL